VGLIGFYLDPADAADVGIGGRLSLRQAYFSSKVVTKLIALIIIE